VAANSLNNRLLQNYLNLSFSSESGGRNNQSPKVDEKLLTNKSKTSLTLMNSEMHGDLQTSSVLNDYAFDNQTSNLIKIAENKNRMQLLDMSSLDYNEDMSSCLEFSRKGSSREYKTCESFAPQQEINRIPSMPKLFYSVSSVATQADMDTHMVIAERKDFKYRNQKEPDRESQIISIEIDLCADSTSDLKSLNRMPFKIKNYPVATGYEKEVAYVKVNDLVAFKNCLRFQLEAAKAAANIIINSRENKSCFTGQLLDGGKAKSGDLKARKMVLRMSARNMHAVQKDQETQSCFKYEIEDTQVEDQIEISIPNESSKADSPFYHHTEEWPNSSQYISSSYHNNNLYFCVNDLGNKNNEPSSSENVPSHANLAAGASTSSVEKKADNDEEIAIDLKLESGNSIAVINNSSSPLSNRPKVMNRAEHLRLMLEQERLILESAKKKKSKKSITSSGSLASTIKRKNKLNKQLSQSKKDRSQVESSQVAYKKLSKRPTFKIKSTNNKNNQNSIKKRGYKSYINSDLLKDLEDRFAYSSFSFVRFNRLIEDKHSESFLSN
jgi:hypothetical protein